MAHILPYPWSLLAPSAEEGRPLSCEDAELAAPLNVETLTFFTRELDEDRPRHIGARSSAVDLTAGSFLNPNTDAGRRTGFLSVLPWTIEKANHWGVRFRETNFELPVSGTLRRASSTEEPLPHNRVEVALRDSLHLLTGYFREAFAMLMDNQFPEYHDFAGQAYVRLDWERIWQRWVRVSTGEEPRMARIVEIARSHSASIREVCERPRRMLVRQREDVSVARVQELDPACLRDLIRRPGRTVLEKAGARQEILAVTRRETVDTAENRVIKDFVRLCQHRARAYERENVRVSAHQKVLAVQKLRTNCERLALRSPIAEVGRLVGVPRPNYVLQKDRRYHPLWLQYEKLRKEEDEVDQIWPWGRRLWAEFIRGVVTGVLTSPAVQNQTGWQLVGELPAYLRTEQQAGSFTPALSISSRFLNRKRNQQLFVVHPAHAHLCPGLNELLPRLGADLVLAFSPADNAPFRPAALLAIYSVLSLDTTTAQRGAMVSSLTATLQHVTSLHMSLRLRGMLLRGEWDPEVRPTSSHHGLLDYLAAPVGDRFWVTEFPELLKILLEEAVE